jgi:RimJ/RimL family protein N-acetyltransferase
MPITPDDRVDRAFLRLHVEAGWGVPVPPLGGVERVALVPESRRPPWSLYVARVGDTFIEIVPHGAHASARQAARLRDALARDPAATGDASVYREVVLRLADAAPAPVVATVVAPFTVRRVARHELALMESFDVGAASYYQLAPDRAPVFAVIAGGRVLAVAHSSRRGAEACELGIETRPEARRRGYALALARLWSAAVLAEGLAPIYSASASNTASLALAAAAGYRIAARAAYLLG